MSSTRSYLLQGQCPTPSQAKRHEHAKGSQQIRTSVALVAADVGFPVGYSELVLPKQLLHLLLLLGYIHHFLLWAFDAVGLGDLLVLGDDHQALL